MTNIFAHKHLVGTPVHCKVKGNGEIVGMDHGCRYPVIVLFDKEVSRDYYTDSGKYAESNKYPTLSFGHKDNYSHDYGTPPEKPIEYPALFELIDGNSAGLTVLFFAPKVGTVVSTPNKSKEVGQKETCWWRCTDTKVWKQIKFSTLDK